MWRKLHDSVIGEYFRDNPTSLRLLILLLGVALGTSLAAAGLQPTDRGWWSSWLQNFSTEMLGAIVTFIGFEVIVNRHNRLAELVSKARIGDAAALEELRQRHKLSGQNLIRAELEFARLMHTDLHGALLWGANMQGAHLHKANLEGARMGGADLRKAHLMDANLQMVNLVKANLRGAKLTGADLRGAKLSDANLQEAVLDGAQFDEHSLLPDRTLWTPESDLRRFVDPAHPHFWHPAPDELGNLPRWFRENENA